MSRRWRMNARRFDVRPVWPWGYSAVWTVCRSCSMWFSRIPWPLWATRPNGPCCLSVMVWVIQQDKNRLISKLFIKLLMLARDLFCFMMAGDEGTAEIAEADGSGDTFDKRDKLAWSFFLLPLKSSVLTRSLNCFTLLWNVFIPLRVLWFFSYGQAAMLPTCSLILFSEYLSCLIRSAAPHVFALHPGAESNVTHFFPWNVFVCCMICNVDVSLFDKRKTDDRHVFALTITLAHVVMRFMVLIGSEIRNWDIIY